MARYPRDVVNLPILRKVWVIEKEGFGFSEDYEKAIRQIIDEIFNPLKTRGSLLRAQEKMPRSKEFPAESIKELESLEYVVTLPAVYEDKITVTPEGLACLASSDTGISLDKFSSLISGLYRKHCFHQLGRLSRKETLKPKHMAVILFFLLNGSIGEDKAYIVQNRSDTECINSVARAFLESSKTRVDERYALEYFLVEAKRILGDVIYNDRPKYYLKKENLNYIIDTVAKASEKYQDFPTRWTSLVHEYHRNLTYLRSRKNSNYTASWEMELENRLKRHLSMRNSGE